MACSSPPPPHPPRSAGRRPGRATSSRAASSGGRRGSTRPGNLVQGNLIGTDAAGSRRAAQRHRRVAILGVRQHHRRDGRRGRQHHRLQPATATGVRVASGTGNAILVNSIFANAGLGIDLTPTASTPNDPGDARRRPQQPPELPRPDVRHRLGRGPRPSRGRSTARPAELPHRVLLRCRGRPVRRRGADLPRRHDGDDRRRRHRPISFTAPEHHPRPGLHRDGHRPRHQ